MEEKGSIVDVEGLKNIVDVDGLKDKLKSFIPTETSTLLQIIAVLLLVDLVL